jgi:hypothetical protein
VARTLGSHEMHEGCPSHYSHSRRLCALPDTKLVLLSPALLFLGLLWMKVWALCIVGRGL